MLAELKRQCLVQLKHAGTATDENILELRMRDSPVRLTSWSTGGLLGRNVDFRCTS